MRVAVPGVASLTQASPPASTATARGEPPTANSWNPSPGTNRATRSSAVSANQRAPSGAAAIPFAFAPAEGRSNRVTVPPVVTRPSWFELRSVNHKAPSAPATIELGCDVASGSRCVVTCFVATSTRPITPERCPVYQIPPSGPAASDEGPGWFGSVTSWNPASVPHPMRCTARRAYQRLPSGPAATPEGFAPSPTNTSVIEPSVVTRPSWFVPGSVNQTAPSGPAPIAVGAPSPSFSG